MKERRRSWADLSGWQIDRVSATPLFRQIYQQIQAAILAQALRPGTKLPSTRELASLLSVSRSAVIAAYEQLLAEGYICGKVGSGTYVSAELPELAQAYEGSGKTRSGTKPSIAAVPDAAKNHLIDVTVQGDARPFNLGRTLIDARTAEAWRRIGTRTFRALDNCHFGYSDPRGLPEFRALICETCAPVEASDANRTKLSLPAERNMRSTWLSKCFGSRARKAGSKIPVMRSPAMPSRLAA